MIGMMVCGDGSVWMGVMMMVCGDGSGWMG